MVDFFDTPAFPVFFVSFLIGIVWGFFVHGLVRAPRWLVDALSQ